MRSSLRMSAGTPKVSSSAQSRAQSCTWTSGVGEVRRLAISASITWPWVAYTMSRTGTARSMVPAMSRRPAKAATTGKAPSALSTLGGPYSIRLGDMADLLVGADARTGTLTLYTSR